MELALSVEVLPGFLEVHLGNRLLGSESQAVGNLVDGDGFLVRPGGKSESPQPASRPQIQKKGSYCVSGGQLASITLNSCVTDTCGGISSAPATSYKCLL